jgi:hypothetical protein
VGEMPTGKSNDLPLMIPLVIYEEKMFFSQRFLAFTRRLGEWRHHRVVSVSNHETPVLQEVIDQVCFITFSASLSPAVQGALRKIASSLLVLLQEQQEPHVSYPSLSPDLCDLLQLIRLLLETLPEARHVALHSSEVTQLLVEALAAYARYARQILGTPANSAKIVAGIRELCGNLRILTCQYPASQWETK